jgi:superfamily I DNA/RNA helicase
MDLSRNIVIEASAGTGKTYTLVQTILQALFQKDLPMESLVALTFTKKAAGEMKERIAAKLQEIDAAEAIHESWRVWGLPLDSLKERARTALETIDRASIGTIHSYAFSLLKKFPLEAGISPEAEVDDKDVKTDELFEEMWSSWLRQQLQAPSSGLQGTSLPTASRLEPGAEGWLEALERVSIKEVRDLARRLCKFDIPLDDLPLSEENSKKALEPYLKAARNFVATKPPKPIPSQMAAACEVILSNACHPPQTQAGDPLPTTAGDDESP